jgi:hypothetical protein
MKSLLLGRWRGERNDSSEDEGGSDFMADTAGFLERGLQLDQCESRFRIFEKIELHPKPGEVIQGTVNSYISYG